MPKSLWTRPFPRPIPVCETKIGIVTFPVTAKASIWNCAWVVTCCYICGPKRLPSFNRSNASSARCASSRRLARASPIVLQAHVINRCHHLGVGAGPSWIAAPSLPPISLLAARGNRFPCCNLSGKHQQRRLGRRPSASRCASLFCTTYAGGSLTAGPIRAVAVWRPFGLRIARVASSTPLLTTKRSPSSSGISGTAGIRGVRRHMDMAAQARYSMESTRSSPLREVHPCASVGFEPASWKVIAAAGGAIARKAETILRRSMRDLDLRRIVVRAGGLEPPTPYCPPWNHLPEDFVKPFARGKPAAGLRGVRISRIV